MNDYERIARVIRYLDEHHDEQPSLDVLAEEVGLSPHHFHRLFSRWASITPKDFLQCLTHEHARALLRSGESVLDAAIESGLSGPGRLHDLCVNIEAATPGEVKSGGEGWTITYGFADSPFGTVLVATNARGLCHLSFNERPEVLEADWPNAALKRNDDDAGHLAELVFDPGKASSRPIQAYVRGTDFQLRVWRALLQIPAATLVSYGHLAGAIGNPSASRAVGTAVGRNPLAVIIPCHRVIRETGVMGGYRWGLTRKRAIIARETGANVLPESFG